MPSISAPEQPSGFRESPVALERLTRPELPRDTTALARFLIGKVLVHDLPEGRVSGRIVETEAYLPGDAACHAFRGPTRRNASLFRAHGHAYVYLSYGCWPLMNVSGEAEGIGAGVLLRAAEPLEGRTLMETRRPARQPAELTRGPGRLAGAMAIHLGLDGLDLCAAGPLWLARTDRPAGEIGVTTRIGITKEADRPLRFFERGSPYVSGPRAALAAGPR
jgi:DNA-3-methyladenine glycosylase